MDPEMLQCDHGAPVVMSWMIAQFLGVVSRCPKIFTCGGVGVDVIEILDKSPSSGVGVHYPF